jgi:hypothetical protein
MYGPNFKMIFVRISSFNVLKITRYTQRNGLLILYFSSFLFHEYQEKNQPPFSEVLTNGRIKGEGFHPVSLEDKLFLGGFSH